MPAHSLELRALKKIPAKYRKNPEKIYDAPPRELDQVYGDAIKLIDDYHVVLNIRSRYCSMDELKAWLLENHPELDLGSGWSMSGGYGGRDAAVTDSKGTVLHIPRETYAALETDHVDKQVFECQGDCWSLDLSRSDATWLEPAMPRYMSDMGLMELVKLRILFARKSDPEDLEDRICETGHTGQLCPDVTGFLADGLAWARKNRTALYACLVD